MKKIHVCLVLLTLLTGCEEKKEPPPKAAFPVTIGEVKQEDVPYYVKGVGQLIAFLDADIKSQVSGTLTNVLFSDGQLVEEGDLLFTIDNHSFKAQVQQTEAQLSMDRARLRYAMEFVKTYGKVVGEEYVSRLDYEQGVQNVDVYKASIESDLAQIELAKINLGYTEIRAPFKGYVGLRKYDPGNYVDVNQNTALVTLKRVTPITVAFNLPAQYLNEIRQEMAKDLPYLQALLPDDPNHPLEGSLYFVDNTVNDETGMIYLQGNLPNEDERGWPGEFVRVNLKLRTIPDAILVPQSAVVLGSTGNFVFVVDEETQTVELRMMGKGIPYQDHLVAEWGLKPSEKVVTDGQLNLYSGAKVYLPKPTEKSDLGLSESSQDSTMVKESILEQSSNLGALAKLKTRFLSWVWSIREKLQ